MLCKAQTNRERIQEIVKFFNGKLLKNICREGSLNGLSSRLIVLIVKMLFLPDPMCVKVYRRYMHRLGILVLHRGNTH
jgi:hypothetical protein